MIGGNVVAYNAAVFIGTLFLLESGADKFVDHTAIVARRTGIPDTLIALLTAGAEWEEVRRAHFSRIPPGDGRYFCPLLLHHD